MRLRHGSVPPAHRPSHPYHPKAKPAKKNASFLTQKLSYGSLYARATQLWRLLVPSHPPLSPYTTGTTPLPLAASYTRLPRPIVRNPPRINRSRRAGCPLVVTRIQQSPGHIKDRRCHPTPPSSAHQNHFLPLPILTTPDDATDTPAALARPLDTPFPPHYRDKSSITPGASHSTNLPSLVVVISHLKTNSHQFPLVPLLPSPLDVEGILSKSHTGGASAEKRTSSPNCIAHPSIHR